MPKPPARWRLFKKFRHGWKRSARRGRQPGGVEVWSGDEARVGQKNKITRRWAKRGTRPVAPPDQRTASTYIFGAICPEPGATAGLVLKLPRFRGRFQDLVGSSSVCMSFS